MKQLNKEKLLEMENNLENDNIFAFQCLFCYEKFKAGANFEISLKEHYYELHEQQEVKLSYQIEALEDWIDEKNDINEVAYELVEDAYTNQNIEYSVLEIEVLNFDASNESCSNDYSNISEHTEEKVLSQSDVIIDEEILNYDEIETIYECNDESVVDFNAKESCDEQHSEPIHAFADLHNKYTNNDEIDLKKCTLCPAAFNNQISLVNHISRVHKNGNKYMCEFCDKQFLSKSMMINHQIRHNDRLNIKCAFCNKMFLLVDKCQKHLQEEHGVVEDDFMNHIIDINIDKKSLYQCKYCLRHFRKKSDYINHESTHIDPRFECTICPAKYHTYTNYKRHLKEKHNLDVQFGNPDTADEIIKEYNLNNRLKKKEFFIKCKVCEQKFYLFAKCEDHLKKMHEIEENVEEFIVDLNRTKFKFRCNYCFKSFNKRSDYNNHDRTHRDPEFQCTICSNKFHTYASLKRHLKKLHDVEIDFTNPDNQEKCLDINGSIVMEYPRPKIERCTEKIAQVDEHICELCGKVLKSARYMEMHIDRHKGIMYECDICKKPFAFKVYLKKHIRVVHLKQRNYSCKICSVTYTDHVGITYHMRTAHSEERPHACEFCDRKFKVRQHLRIHMLIHTGIKNYRCKPCGKSYSRSAGRKKHNRSIHGIASTKIALNDEEPKK